MAINAGTVLAYLDLDTSKFGNAMQMAQSQMGSFAQEGSGLTGMLDGVGSAMTTVGRAMTLGVTTPLIGVGTAITKAAIGWESAFADVRKTVNITSGDVEAGYKKIADGLTKMSTLKPVSAEVLAGIAANAGQLGVAEEYILSFTGVMADLEVATNLTGEEAASMFAQYANITGMDLGKISNLGSTVVELGNNTATTERDIAEMMHRLAGAGSIIGLTDAEIAGMSATLTSLGINAEAGGSAMSRVLSDMNSAVIGGGKDLKKFAKIAGVSSKEFASAWKADPISAMQLFTQGLNNISLAGGDVDAALDKVGLNDIRITDMLKRLMGSGDMLTHNVEMANDAWEKNTALTDEAAKRYETTASKLQMLKNAVTNTAREFGNVLLPVVNKVTEWITKGVQWLGNLDDGMKKTIVTAGGIAAALGPALTIGGKLLSGFSGIIPLAGAVAGAFALVYNRSERLQQIVGDLKTGGLAAFDGLKKGIAAYSEATKGGATFTEAIGTAISAAFGSENGAKVNGVVGSILTGFGKAKTAVTGTLNGLGEFVAKLIDGEDASIALEMGLLAAFNGDVPQKVRDTQAAIEGFIGGVQAAYAEGGILGALGNIGTQLGAAVSRAWASAKEGISSLRNKIGDGLGLAREWLEPKARQWMTNLGEAYEKAKSYATDKLPAVREAIMAGITGAKTKITAAAKTTMKWLGESYRSGVVQRALGKLEGVGQTIMEKITTGKEMLTEKAGEMMEWLGEALGSASIQQKIGDLSNIATGIAQKISVGVGFWKTTAFTLLSGLVQQLTDNGFLQTALDGVGNIVTGIADGLMGAAGNIATAGAMIITALIESLTSGGLIESTFTKAGEIVTAIAGKIGGVADQVISASLKIGTALIDGIVGINWPSIFTTAGNVVTSIGTVIISAASSITTASYELMAQLVAGMSKIEWSSLIDTVGTVAGNLLGEIGKAIPKVTDGVLGLMTAIVNGISTINWSSIGTSLAGVATKLLDGIMDNLPATIEGVGKIVDKIGEGIGAAGAALGAAAGSLISGLITWILTPENWAKLLNVGVSIADGISEGIVTLGGGVLKGAASAIIEILKGVFKPIIGSADAGWSTDVRTAMNGVVDVMDVEGAAIRLKGIELLDSLNQPIINTEGLYNAMAAYAYACESGIQDTFPQAQWVANDAIVGLFGVMVDASQSESERAKAMAVLLMSGYGDIVANAVMEDRSSVQDAARKLMDGANEEVNNAVETLTSTIPGSMSSGLESGIPILEEASKKVAEIASAAKEQANIEADAKGVGEGATEKLAEGQNAKVGEVETSTQGVSDTVTGTMEPLPGLMEAIGNNGITGMATGELAAQPQVTAATQAISTDAVNTALKTMSVAQGTTIGQGFAGAIATGIGSRSGSVSGTARSTASSGVSAMRSAMSSGTGYSIGQGMIQGVINGVASMSSSLASRMRAVASAAVSAFRNKLQMHSPSRLLMADGALIPTSYALGVEGNKKTFIRSMIDLAGAAQDVWPGIDMGENVPRKPRIGGFFNAATDSGLVFNFYGDMTVREEADIRRISAELRDEFVEELRGRGY